MYEVGLRPFIFVFGLGLAFFIRVGTPLSCTVTAYVNRSFVHY